MTGGIAAAVTGLFRFGNAIIEVNRQVSDAIADVAKAANVSIEFVDSLTERLKGRRTRTSLLDQLGIAEIGGKLGVAKDQLFEFVEAVDVVNVALGDQFGGDVEATTDTLGKLRNVLGDIKTENVGQDIVRIGNALNFLEAQGVASGATIADFTGRIGGVATTLGVASGKIIGVSTTLNELNLNAERGSTGFIRILQRVAQTPEAFAKAAGVSAEEFTKLVNDDLFGAVTLFLEKINDRNLSNTELAQTLKSLKLTGVGVSEVVSKLGGNLGLLNTRVNQATESLTNADSVTQEFEKKNANLAAELSRLSNNFKNLFTNSDFANTVAGFVGGFADMIGSGEKLSDQLRQQQTDFNALIGVLQDTTIEEDQRNRILTTLKEQYPGYLKFVDDDVNGQVDLAKSLAFGNQLFEQRILLQATEEERTRITKDRIAAENELTRALIEQQKAEDLRGKGRGPARNEAADLQASENINTQAQRRIVLARKRIADLNAELAKLNETADATSLRTTGKTIAELQNGIDDILTGSGETGTGGGNDTGDGKIKALAGSIQFLEEQVKSLEDTIQKTPVNAGVLPKLLKDLDQAKLKLEVAKQAFQRLRFFTQFGFDLAAPDQGAQVPPTIDLIPELDTPGNKQSAKEQAAALAKAVQDDLDAIEFPVEIDKEGLSAFEKEIERAREEDNKRREESAEAEAERQAKIREALIEGAVSATQSAADAIFQIKENQIQKEEKQAFEALDRQEKEALDKAKGNAKKEDQIRREFDEKRAEQERKFAQKRKENARKEALINIALAVTKALTGAVPPFNFILAGLAAVAGAAQLAVINTQEFAEGGVAKKLKPGTIKEKPNAPRTPKGDNVLAYVSPGEMILNKLQQARLMSIAGNDIFGRAGVPGYAQSATPVPHFATGGLVGILPQTTIAGSASQLNINTKAEFSPEQIQQLGVLLGISISNAVAPTVKTAIGEGLDDANRRTERQAALNTQRQG